MLICSHVYIYTHINTIYVCIYIYTHTYNSLYDAHELARDSKAGSVQEFGGRRPPAECFKVGGLRVLGCIALKEQP